MSDKFKLPFKTDELLKMPVINWYMMKYPVYPYSIPGWPYRIRNWKDYFDEMMLYVIFSRWLICRPPFEVLDFLDRRNRWIDTGCPDGPNLLNKEAYLECPRYGETFEQFTSRRIFEIVDRVLTKNGYE